MKRVSASTLDKPSGSHAPGGPHTPTAQAGVLIVDDDPIAGESLADFLSQEGMFAQAVLGGDEALAAIERSRRVGASDAGVRPIGVVISDVAMPGMNGLALLARVKELAPDVAVLLMTGYGTIEQAVEAVRLGAADYLTKPIVDAELRLSLERALRQRDLLTENHQLKDKVAQMSATSAIVGSDPRMLRIFELIESVAPSKTTVLMTGESGVGKSLIAQAIHQRSPRRDRPFVQLSCGSIPETLLESELFGHVKGAFTGAYADKVGRFLAADGGTIFLDEINSASPGMQLKLLRVLQERRFEPVGSTQTIEVDARVVLATNKPLEDLVARGEFRQDLYYRVNVVTIELPPLRDRLSDVPMLATHFLEKHAAELGRQIVGFTAEAMHLLCSYRFPGNVRELENIVERACVLTRSPSIGVESLPDAVVHGTPQRTHSQPSATTPSEDPVWTPMPLEQALAEPERRIILKALKANGFNRQKTADDLRINRTTLYKKMRQLGIDASDGRLAG